MLVVHRRRRVCEPQVCPLLHVPTYRKGLRSGKKRTPGVCIERSGRRWRASTLAWSVGTLGRCSAVRPTDALSVRRQADVCIVTDADWACEGVLRVVMQRELCFAMARARSQSCCSTS